MQTTPPPWRIRNACAPSRSGSTTGLLICLFCRLIMHYQRDITTVYCKLNLYIVEHYHSFNIHTTHTCQDPVVSDGSSFGCRLGQKQGSLFDSTTPPPATETSPRDVKHCLRIVFGTGWRSLMEALLILPV